MTIFGIDTPPWFAEKLMTHYGPNYTINNVMAFLFQDYLDRNAPCEHHYVDRFAWNHQTQSEDRVPTCCKCNHELEANSGI